MQFFPRNPNPYKVRPITITTKTFPISPDKNPNLHSLTQKKKKREKLKDLIHKPCSILVAQKKKKKK